MVVGCPFVHKSRQCRVDARTLHGKRQFVEEIRPPILLCKLLQMVVRGLLREHSGGASSSKTSEIPSVCSPLGAVVARCDHCMLAWTAWHETTERR